MKRLTGSSSLWQRMGRLALTALVVGSALLAGAAPGYAAGDEGPLPQAEVTEAGFFRLEFAYLRIRLAADTQALHLDYGAELAGRVQDWIETLAEGGRDVSGLQAGLDAFRAALVEAEGHHDRARAVLDSHAGFDEAGKVTDREAAVETLREAGRALRDARHALREGGIQLRRAIADWLRENRPRPVEARPGV